MVLAFFGPGKGVPHPKAVSGHPQVKGGLWGTKGILPLGLEHELLMKADIQDHGGGFGNRLKGSPGDRRPGHLKARSENLAEMHMAEGPLRAHFSRATLALGGLGSNNHQANSMLGARVLEQPSDGIELVLRLTQDNRLKGPAARQTLKRLSNLMVHVNLGIPVGSSELPLGLGFIRLAALHSGPLILGLGLVGRLCLAGPFAFAGMRCRSSSSFALSLASLRAFGAFTFAFCLSTCLGA